MGQNELSGVGGALSSYHSVTYGWGSADRCIDEWMSNLVFFPDSHP